MTSDLTPFGVKFKQGHGHYPPTDIEAARSRIKFILHPRPSRPAPDKKHDQRLRDQRLRMAMKGKKLSDDSKGGSRKKDRRK